MTEPPRAPGSEDTPRWRIRFTASLLALVAFIVAFRVFLDVASQTTAYYAMAALQLCLAIVGIVLVAALLVYATLRSIELIGTPRLWKNRPLYLGWHLFKNQRVVEPMRDRVRRAKRHVILPTSLLLALASVVVLLLLFLPNFEFLLPAGHLWKPWVEDLHGLFVLYDFATLVSSLAMLALSVFLGVWGRLDKASTRRPRRQVLRNIVTTPTFIAIIGVSVGVWALIVVLSVMSGFESDLRDKILRTQDHVQIQHTPEVDQELGEIAEHFALADRLNALEGVAGAYAYVHGEVMLSSPTNISTSVSVKGISPRDLIASGQMRTTMEKGGVEFLAHPERLVADTPFSDHLRNASGALQETQALLGGNYNGGNILDLSPSPRVFPGIMVGRELAKSLKVTIGSEVQIISPEGGVGPMGVQPRSRSFRVAGIFNTGMYEYDMRLVYMSLSEAQRFFDMGDTVNRMELRVADTKQTDAVLQRLEPELAPRQLEALDWKALNRSLFSALELEKMVMFIVLGFIILVASFAIVASLVMIVMEKAREIAILKSMGTTNATVRNTFMAFGLVIGLVGTSAGLILGVLTCEIIDRVGLQLPKAYYIESLPVTVNPLELLAVGVSAVGVCVLATLYPSMTASRLRPVEGLRYE